MNWKNNLIIILCFAVVVAVIVATFQDFAISGGSGEYRRDMRMDVMNWSGGSATSCVGDTVTSIELASLTVSTETAIVTVYSTKAAFIRQTADVTDSTTADLTSSNGGYLAVTTYKELLVTTPMIYLDVLPVTDTATFYVINHGTAEAGEVP